MSLFSVFNIVGSALDAHITRLNTTASNLANANSESSSIKQTYRARHPVFVTQQYGSQAGLPQLHFNRLMDDARAGVRVAGIVESQAPVRKEHKPDSPHADSEGYVYLPNVNVVEEMANMISASRSYQSGVETFNTSKQMLLRTLTLAE